MRYCKLSFVDFNKKTLAIPILSSNSIIFLNVVDKYYYSITNVIDIWICGESISNLNFCESQN